MLIYLHDSIASAIDKLELENDDFRVLEYLADASRSGKHIVVGDHPTIQRLAGCNELGRTATAAYTHILNTLAEYGRLKNDIIRRIEITSRAFAAELREKDRCRVFRLPINEFGDFESVGKSILLAENLVDADFYGYIARTIMVRRGFRSLRLAFESRGGGGSTIANEYERIQSQGIHLCLCIVDSDKKAPDCPIGRTARAVQDVEEPEKLKTEHHILPVRSVENLIPTRMLLNWDSVDGHPAVTFVQSIEASAVPDARNFINMKDGIRLHDVSPARPETEIARYWKSILESVGRSLDCPTGYTCDSTNTCTCVVCEGFGSTHMRRFVEDVLGKCTPHKIEETLCDVSGPTWEEIGELVIAWCCARHPQRA